MLGPVKFGDLIRVRADSSETARDFAETYKEIALEKSHARMMDIAQYNDMPGDCFILTGLHWRESMSPMNERFENGADYVRWLQSDDSKPGGEEQATLADRIDQKRREIVERELADPEKIETIDLRDETVAGMSGAFRIQGDESAQGIGTTMHRAARISHYLRAEFMEKSGDMTVITPTGDPFATYIFRGDTHGRYLDLMKTNDEPGSGGGDMIPTLFGWFVEGLREMGLLQEIDVREQDESSLPQKDKP